MSQDTPDIVEPDWAKEVAALIEENEVKPDGFALYLNFMLPYNTDENGVIDEAAPYIDITEELSSEDSQTRFLIQALAAKYSVQVQTAWLRDPVSDVEAGYHYGLFYIGDDIVSTFVPLRADLEIEFSRLFETKKVPVLPLMQFALLSQTPPDEAVGQIDEDDADLF